MEIIRVGHITFLVKVELTWVQDIGCSRRLLTNTLNINYMEQITQNKIIIQINFLYQQLIVVHVNFLLEN